MNDQRVWNIEWKLKDATVRSDALEQRLITAGQRIRNASVNNFGDGLSDNYTTLTIVVKGCDGDLLEGVLVQMGVGASPTTFPFQGLTDVNGEVAFSVESDATYGYKVTPSNYYRATTVASTLGSAGTVTVTLSPSCGYSSTPAITFTGGGGSGATAYATLGGSTGCSYVSAVTVSNPGASYGSAPSVVFSSTAGGYGASATAYISGVNGTTITNAGTTYTGLSVPISLSGGSPSIVATLTGYVSSGSIYAISIDNPGADYSTAPSLTFPAPSGGGTTATATCTIALGKVTSIVIDNPGNFYACWGGCGAVRSNGYLSDCYGTERIVNGSTLNTSGYGVTSKWCPNSIISNPTADFCFTYTLSSIATGSKATGTCTIASGMIDTVTLTNGGYGFVHPPTITLSGGGGTGGVISAVLTGDVVTGLTITNAGSGYTSAPTLVFSNPDYRIPGLSITCHYCGLSANNPAGPCPDYWDGVSACYGFAPVFTEEAAVTSWTCYPFSIDYDFTGTMADGIVFQGSSSRVVTYSA